MGAGLGHVTRMKSVLSLLDWELNVSFALRYPDKARHLVESDQTVYQAPFYNLDIKEVSPNFSHILWRSGWHDHDVAKPLVSEWQTLFKQTGADMVFIDHAPTAAMAACLSSIPYFQFGNGFEIPPASIPFPSLLPESKIKNKELKKWDEKLNTVLSKVIGTRRVGNLNFQQLFDPDSSLILVHPALDHYVRPDSSIQYLPLLSNVQGASDLSINVLFGKKKLFIYLEKDTPDLLNKLRILSQTFTLFGYVSGLELAHIKSLKSNDIHLSDKPVNIVKAMHHCEGVICHGGIGTVTQALMADKRLMVMPRHVEQNLLAYRLEKQALALKLPLASSPDLLLSVARQYLSEEHTVLPSAHLAKSSEKLLKTCLRSFIESKLG